MSKFNQNVFRAALTPMLICLATMMACKDGDTGSAGLDDTGGIPPSTCELCDEQETDGPELIPLTCTCPNPISGFPDIIGSGCGIFGEPVDTEDCSQQCILFWDSYDEITNNLACTDVHPAVDCGLVEGLACSDFPDSGDCSGWSPSSAISLANGIYYVDATFVSDLIDDSSPLWTCSGEYFKPKTTTGFSLAEAAPGRLFYELGLRNKDVPVSINGLPLDDLTDVIAAFTKLWFYDGATSFDLVVKRGTTTLHRIYVLQ